MSDKKNKFKKTDATISINPMQDDLKKMAGIGSVPSIIKSVTSIGKKGKVKVFRGDTSKKSKDFNMDKFYEKNPVHKFMDKQNMGKRFNEIKNKRDKTAGRWFTTNKEVAKSYKNKKDGVIQEVEISKKDLIIGDKMKKRYFKDVEMSDDTILLPRKNLKDIKISKSKGGFVIGKGKKYIKDLL